MSTRKIVTLTDIRTKGVPVYCLIDNPHETLGVVGKTESDDGVDYIIYHEPMSDQLKLIKYDEFKERYKRHSQKDLDLYCELQIALRDYIHENDIPIPPFSNMPKDEFWKRWEYALRIMERVLSKDIYVGNYYNIAHRISLLDFMSSRPMSGVFHNEKIAKDMYIIIKTWVEKIVKRGRLKQFHFLKEHLC